MATGRAKRPETFACKGAEEINRSALPAYKEECPFCSGNEAMTPPGILALNAAGETVSNPESPGWQVRVVSNKFPALDMGEETAIWPSIDFVAKDQPFFSLPGFGIHEVIIETPEHNRHPGLFVSEQVNLMVETYYRRLFDLEKDPRIKYIQLFRNHGHEAGASIEHPHSQLIALPFIPELVVSELQRSQLSCLELERCPYCVLLESERDALDRMVIENEYFAAFMPYSSRYPFEIWLLPRRHQSSFLEQSQLELAAFAELLSKMLRFISQALDDPPYNYYLQSAPARAHKLPYFHWRLELVPKLSIAAGFELGTGVFINTTLPEEAAAFIRDKGRLTDETRKHDLLYSGPAQSPACGQFR